MVTPDTAPPKSLPSSISRVSPETVEKAVKALFKWKDSKSNTQKPQLLSQDDFLYLILTLKKIPPNGGRKTPHKIPLPHPILNDEFCLIIDDRPKSNLTLESVKKKVKSENIPVSKVLKFTKLKTDYKPFEARRKLCDSYDLFFADKRIIPYLPKLLGNKFFKKKKLPLSVDLGHKNWKEQIEKVCSSALLFMNAGTCSVVRVGKVSMEIGEIVENVVEAINGVVEFVPNKWEGVRSFHLKFTESLALPVYPTVPESLALPVYPTVPSMKLKIQGISEYLEGVEGGGSEVEVKEGRKKDVKLNKKKEKKKKGRIHEVRYMDDSVSEDELGNDIDGDDNESEKSEDDDLGSDEFVEKKRKNGGLVKKRGFLELNADKLGKKIGKVGKKGRGDLEDGNDGEKSEKDDSDGAEFEVKKKKKGHLTVNDRELSSGKKGKRKNGLGTTVKNLADKKITRSKKKQPAE